MQARGIAPFQRSTVNLNHCARFVFLSRAIDETDSPSYVAKVVLLPLLLPPPVVLLRVRVLAITGAFNGSLLIATSH